MALNATNGTFVQGVRVSSAHLAPGSEIQLVKTRIVFCPLQEAHDIPLSRNEAFGSMMGRSVPMRRIFYLAETYSPSDATIMITGETGTGKEILAEEIHKHSPSNDKPNNSRNFPNPNPNHNSNSSNNNTNTCTDFSR